MCDQCKDNWLFITQTLDEMINAGVYEEEIIKLLLKNAGAKQITTETRNNYLDTIKRHYPDIYARVEKLMALQ